jgi:hypothetical protein
MSLVPSATTPSRHFLHVWVRELQAVLALAAAGGADVAPLTATLDAAAADPPVTGRHYRAARFAQVIAVLQAATQIDAAVASIPAAAERMSGVCRRAELVEFVDELLAQAVTDVLESTATDAPLDETQAIILAQRLLD